MRSFRHRAFTLVELLVSIAVLCLLVIAFSTMFSALTKVWRLEEARKERGQSARVAEKAILDELSSALLPLRRDDVRSLQFIVNPPGIAAEYRNRDAIFWQAPIAQDDQFGDIAEIGYFVQWDTSSAGNPRASLRRFFVQAPDSTNGVLTQNPNFLIYQSPDAWITDALIATVAPGDQANDYRGLFVENVVGLWVRCLDPLGNEITASGATFDSRDGYTYTDPSHTPPTVTLAPCALPGYVEISVAILDSNSASRVGPAEQAAIVQLAGQAGNAGQFVSLAQNSAALQAVSKGIHSREITASLSDAR